MTPTPEKQRNSPAFRGNTPDMSGDNAQHELMDQQTGNRGGKYGRR
jgi:hypothetical protein